MKTKLRKELHKRDGLRFRCVGMVQRFGSKRGWKGATKQTILLVGVKDATTGKKLTDHLWFTAGKWSAGVCEGDTIQFDARSQAYEKGYQGCADWFNVPDELAVDWKLTRPTKVTILPKADNPQCLPSPPVQTCGRVSLAS